MRREVLCNIKKINSSCRYLCIWPVEPKIAKFATSAGKVVAKIC